MVFRVLAPVLRLVMVPERESGERVLFLASGRYPARAGEGVKVEEKTEEGVEVARSSDGVLGGGAYRVNWDGEEVPLKKNYPELRREGFGEKAWGHTMEALTKIEAGRVFKN